MASFQPTPALAESAGLHEEETETEPVMNRSRCRTNLINGTALILLSILPLLVIAAIQLPVISRLHSNVAALRPGMSISQVQQQMGSKPNWRFDTPDELKAALPHIELVPPPLPEKMRGPLLIYAFKNEGSDFVYLYFDHSHQLVEIIAPGL